MVSKSLEKDAASKQRYLKGLDINVDLELVPCVSSKAVGDKSCEQAIEVEEEEQRQDATNKQLYQKDPAALFISLAGVYDLVYIPVKALARVEWLSCQACDTGHALDGSRCRTAADP